MERHRLDVPDPRPFHRAAFFDSEPAAGILRIAVHPGKDTSVQISLIERHLASAHYGRDDSRKGLDAADRANGVRVRARDVANLQRELRSRRKRVAARVHRSRSRMRLLSEESNRVPF